MSHEAKDRQLRLAYHNLRARLAQAVKEFEHDMRCPLTNRCGVSLQAVEEQEVGS